MNDLEFIIDKINVYENEIKKLKELKIKFMIEFDLEDDKVIEIDFQLEEYKETLQILYQIKAKLEAWEVVKYGMEEHEDFIRIRCYEYPSTSPQYHTLKKTLVVEE